MKNRFLKKLGVCAFALALQIHGLSLSDICFAAKPGAYAIKPWEVGQFASYQIITMEGESAGNRYEVSIVGEEPISGKQYFWVKTDIFEAITVHGHNSIDRRLAKNISLKALVPPKSSDTFAKAPADFISNGIFPSDAVKLLLQIGEGPWNEVDPRKFFQHQDILNHTPYSQTPDARATIDFAKLIIDPDLSGVAVPAGVFSCRHLWVKTTSEEAYWQEGFDLWRSAEVPILGLVKMEFSKTDYPEKLAFKNRTTHVPLSSQRVPGRMRPDTCTILLLDYGPKK